MQSPEKDIQEQLVEALDLIEKTIGNKVYLTRTRIKEVLEKEYPGFKQNFYLAEPNALLFLLLWLQQSGNIEMVPGCTIYTSERFEESQYEPVLYEDIPDEQSRTFFNEISFSDGFAKWKGFIQINAELMDHTQSTVLGLINILKKEGVTPHNVFYRRIDTPKNKKKEILPVLPITIE